MNEKMAISLKSNFYLTLILGTVLGVVMTGVFYELVLDGKGMSARIQSSVPTTTNGEETIGVSQEGIKSDLIEVQNAKKSLIDKIDFVNEAIKANNLTRSAIKQSDNDPARLSQLEKENAQNLKDQQEWSVLLESCEDVEKSLILASRDLEFGGSIKNDIDLRQIGSKLDRIRAVLESREFVYGEKPQIDLLLPPAPEN